MELSIVIPVCNEADCIGLLCTEVRESLRGLDYEIVVVDDGSTDGTAGKLAAIAAWMPQLRVVRHAANAGQSAALLSGVRAARAEWIATLDGDGQNDPADVLRMWRLAISGSPDTGLYIGHRRTRRDSAIRIASSLVANGVRSRLLHDRAPDTGCGVKLFRRELFLSLPYFDHMHRFMPALVQREGRHVVSVPVNHRRRTGGVSKYGVMDRLWVGIVDTLGVMWLLRRRRRPELVEEGSPHGR